MITLDLIVPCYNEGPVIQMFYDETTKVLNGLLEYDCRLIMVDDGSRDNTLKLMKQLAQNDSRVKYISFSRNFGKEAAMLAGLRYSDADFVGIMDADLQHSPSLIPKMLEAVEGDYDVAAAKRTDRTGEGKIKSTLSSAFYRVANQLSEVEIDSGAQDFRIMRRKVVEAILSMAEYNRFTKGIFSFVGFKTKWFPHENLERAAGFTKWSIFNLFKYAFNGILAFSNKPLRFSFAFGGLSCFSAFVYLLILLILKVKLPEFPNAFQHLTFSVGLLLFGILMISIGILGEYIGRVYSEVKNRPVFIISDTNFKK